MPECEKCGVKYKKDDLFCSKCGAKIKEKTPTPGRKSPKKTLLKEEKLELSEDAKRKLKAELEGSIKAFKRGEITLEEFQNIKKGIVAKAKAGMYRNPVAQKVGAESQPLPPPSPRRLPPPPAAGELYRPLRRADEPPFSKLWFIVPILFNIFGGVVAYFAIRPVDEKNAKKMLAIGAVSLVVMVAMGGYYLKSENLWPFEKKVEAPKEIVIEEGVIEDVLDSGEVTPIIPTNSSPEEMNIRSEDLESGFYVNPLLTGTLRDPLEFASGNLSFAEELEAQGWLENHRIVLKKDFVDSEKNATIAEKEIDSSISKYDANQTSKKYFEEKLRIFEKGLLGDNYTLIEFEINESGVMGKKVQYDEEKDITRVTYKVLFYKQDTIVDLSVKGVTRRLDENEVIGYARLIEERIK